MTSNRYADRNDAGQVLAKAVQALKLHDPVVVALPRGGVPVALAVARRLDAPLDILVVRKIGAPFQRELAVACLVGQPAPDMLIDEAILRSVGADHAYVHRQAVRERAELERREALYRSGRPAVVVQGREVVLVDDGVATGTTMRVALQALRRQQPARLILAVPVGPPDTIRALRPQVDELVCPLQPEPFLAVGAHYDAFDQVEDEEVVRMLTSEAAGRSRSGPIR